MTSIKLIVSGARIQAKVCGPLTGGMVGVPVSILYDDIWENLTKTLVCRGGDRIFRAVSGIGAETTVAPEVLRPRIHLFLGIEGRSADGTLVIPTLWADCGPILDGANVSADESTQEDNPFWFQLQNRIGSLENLTTEEKNSLVGALNEIAASLTAHDGDANAHPSLRAKITQLNVQKVPTSRTINGKALSGNITLTPQDIGAAPAQTLGNAAVYAKSVSLGALGAAGTTVTAPHQCGTRIIGCHAVAVKDDGSCMEFTCGSSEGSVRTEGANVVFTCLGDLSGYTGTAWIRYIL